MSVNKVILLGRLGQDPELKYTPTGQPVCSFSMATTENWSDRNGQKQEKTEWHKIVVWGKLGELCNQYLAKGRQAFIEGKLQTRSWEKDGQKKYMTEINATTVQFIGGQPNASRSDNKSDNRPVAEQQQGSGAPAQGGDNLMDQDFTVSTDANFTADDIPF